MFLGNSKKALKQSELCNCRADWIRTSDPYVPNVVRYRAALLPRKKKGTTIQVPFGSGGLDSNQRPLAPHANALPGCATTRILSVRVDFKINA